MTSAPASVSLVDLPTVIEVVYFAQSERLTMRPRFSNSTEPAGALVFMLIMLCLEIFAIISSKPVWMLILHIAW